jgi:hypothetical protein
MMFFALVAAGSVAAQLLWLKEPLVVLRVA